MSKKDAAQHHNSIGMYILTCVVLFVLAMAGFMGSTKMMAALAAVVVIWLLFTRNVNSLKRLPAIFVLGFVAVSGLTGFWAMSGKFFLNNFSFVAIAAAGFLFVVTSRNFGRESMKKVMALVAGVAAIFAALSVEAATTGLTAKILKSFPQMSQLGMGFEEGTRLTGILGNANVLASILALGIFFSIALLCEADSKGMKRLYAALLAVNAFSFLLAFSMGGIACFSAAIVIYLIFAGKQRGAILLRMLEGAIPALIWGFVSFPFFNRGGVLGMLPLILLVCNVVTVVFLEEKLASRLAEKLNQHQKVVLGLLAGIAVLGVVYIVAGMNVTGAYTFETDTLRRSAYPESGEHTLEVQASGDVSVSVISQNMSQVMMHTNTVVYEGPVSGAKFTVPEESEVCYFTFSAPAGVTVEQVVIDGETEIPLDYKLLPGFIANRIQGLKANQNAIQRTVFFEDGMKMFKQHPILGSGMGAFETGAFSVQDFYYETRYVHNHYIQVLLDSGIVGFLFYVGSLFTMAWVLLKSRKAQNENPVAWAAPALWAALAMIVFHGAVEVSMSDLTFLTFAFVTFGMITAGFAPKLGSAKEEQPEVVKTKKTGAKDAKKIDQPILRGALCVLPAVFLVTLALNGAARTIARKPAADTGAFMQNLKIAAEMDPYEANDAKLSYVLNSVDYQTEETMQQAEKYADELMQVQSNAIPVQLVSYYLNTQQYFKAVDAAKRAAVCSASDHAVWNDVFRLFEGALMMDPEFPLATGDSEFLAALQEYYEMMLEHNATSMEPIQLEERLQSFVDTFIAPQ